MPGSRLGRHRELRHLFRAGTREGSIGMMRWLLRFLFLVLVAAVVAVAAYTFIGDMAPDIEERRVPVPLSTD